MKKIYVMTQKFYKLHYLIWLIVSGPLEAENFSEFTIYKAVAE